MEKLFQSKRTVAVAVALGLILVGFCVTIFSASKGQAQSAAREGLAVSSAPAPKPVKITPSQAAWLGVVEGLTEYLPVSSTGHLILAGHAMGLAGEQNGKFVESDAISAFDIVIQLGAILAVLGLYRKRVAQMFRGLAGRDRDGLKLVGLLLLAFLPAAVVGLAVHKQIKAHLFAPLPVCFALAVGGAAMIFVERRYYNRSKVVVTPEPSLPDGMEPDSTTATPDAPARLSRIELMSYRQALFIGLFQCLAMWPGTSRSMITMIAAILVGLDMVAAAEFSFLLALPTLGAATLYEGWQSRTELMQSVGGLELAIGLVVSGIVAALAVKAFVTYLTKHGLVPFGIYRLLLAGAVLIYFIFHS
jgi:undecaprenyl-diphosphatase